MKSDTVGGAVGRHRRARAGATMSRGKNAVLASQTAVSGPAGVSYHPLRSTAVCAAPNGGCRCVRSASAGLFSVDQLSTVAA